MSSGQGTGDALPRTTIGGLVRPFPDLPPIGLRRPPAAWPAHANLTFSGIPVRGQIAVLELD